MDMLLPTRSSEWESARYGSDLGAWNREGESIDSTGGPHAYNEAISTAGPGISYDGNGNLTTLDSLRYIWDVKDRHIGFLEGSDVHAGYHYDYEGERRIRSVQDAADNTGAALYVDSKTEMRNGRMLMYVFQGDSRLSVADGARSRIQSFSPDRAFLHNHIRSISHISLSDGSLARQNSDLPFGSARRQDSSVLSAKIPYRFADKESDAESQLNYFGARYQSPGFSGFISVDPVLLSGPTRWLAVPQTLNGNSYALNNPSKYEDPRGEWPSSGDIASFGGHLTEVASNVLQNAVGSRYAHQQKRLRTERGIEMADVGQPGKVYWLNRELGGPDRRFRFPTLGFFNPSHALMYTTSEDGTLRNTMSYGIDSGFVKEWAYNNPLDMAAAQQDIDARANGRVGFGQEMDTSVWKVEYIVATKVLSNYKRRYTLLNTCKQELMRAIKSAGVPASQRYNITSGHGDLF